MVTATDAAQMREWVAAINACCGSTDLESSTAADIGVGGVGGGSGVGGVGGVGGGARKGGGAGAAAVAAVWQPNSDAAACSCCSDKFTITKRRHHCRCTRRIYNILTKGGQGYGTGY